MIRRILLIGSTILISLLVGGVLGYLLGRATVNVTLRDANIDYAIGDLDLQIGALKETRSEMLTSIGALGQIENLTFASIVILKGLKPDISKLGYRKILALCQAESYFRNYGISKSANNQVATLVVGYLKEILPSVQSRAAELGIPKSLDNHCGQSVQ
ncbi:MAG: hypothetical protein ACRD4Q_06050 [Candidatus Acidiferrales bacterium]